MGGVRDPDNGLHGDRFRLDTLEPVFVPVRCSGLVCRGRVMERQGPDAGSSGCAWRDDRRHEQFLKNGASPCFMVRRPAHSGVDHPHWQETLQEVAGPF